MKNILILYVCTGRYDIFWEGFLQSAEKFFFPSRGGGYSVQYAVFTDAEHIAGEEHPRVQKLYQENLGWPYNTLLRYHIFAPYVNDIKKFDYVFFFNANIRFITPIGEEILPKDDELLVVKHPGFWNRRNTEWTYERNPISTACIPFGQGNYYVFGCFNGAPGNLYAKMILDIKQNTDEDLKNNFIAVWHDESHLNKYILSHRHKLLDPGYAFPEGFTKPFPFEPKVLLLDKSKVADVNYLRGII